MSIKLFTLSLIAAICTTFGIPSANADSFTGSGSTFSLNFIEQCKVKFYIETRHNLTYTPNGSGAGRNAFTNSLVDFAVSDTPYGSSDPKPSKPFVYVPLVSGPIAVAYKLDNYPNRVKLTKTTLAKIFAGQITKWNHPEIAKINTGKLPNIPISVIYRSDGSGTSEVFTSYLNAIAPSIWSKAGNKSFASAFPGDINKFAGYFQAVNGSSMIAMTQITKNGSISYNEVSFTKALKTALIQNESNKFVGPTQSATSAFLAGLKFNAGGTAPLNFKNKSATAYNISTFTYALAYVDGGSKNKIVKDFLSFAITKCGNIEGYAPLTGAALKAANSQISKIDI